MNVTETNKKILDLYRYQKLEELNKLLTHLTIERMKIDKFLSKFLDMFERKMSYENTETPVWDLYKKKLDEHEKLSQCIQTANHYLQK
jgi:hypothetical protein